MIKDPRFQFKVRLLSLLAMVMVVYVHAYTVDLQGYAGTIDRDKNINTFIQDIVSHGLARVASPLFFMIAGFMLFSGFKLQTSLIVGKYLTRFRTLLLPFLLWSAFGIGLYYILQLIPPLRPFFANHIIDRYNTEQLLHTLLISPIPYQLWFLRDLIMLVLIFPVIWVVVKYLKEAAIVLMFAAWLTDLDLIVFTSGSLLFFSFGCLLTLRPAAMARLVSNYNYKLPLITWVSLLLLKTGIHYAGFTSVATFMLLHKFALIIGIYAVWLTINTLADKEQIASRRWLHTSVSAFFIYAFHEPQLSILKKALLYVLGEENELTSLLIYFLAPLLTILICIVTASVLKNVAPGLFGLLTGRRTTITRPAMPETVLPTPETIKLQP